MVTITYNTLDELTHNVAYEIEKATGLNKDTMLDLFALNDTMTSYLDRYGVQYEDEKDCFACGGPVSECDCGGEGSGEEEPT